MVYDKYTFVMNSKYGKRNASFLFADALAQRFLPLVYNTSDVWFRQSLMEGQGQLAVAVIGHTDMVWTLRTPESKGRVGRGEGRYFCPCWLERRGWWGEVSNSGERSCYSPLPCIVIAVVGEWIASASA